jgi:dihydrofolate reductase
MKKDSFKITVHMVSSLDGIIAKKDNSVSWFDTPDNFEKGVTVTAEDSNKFLKTIDCYVMGARTYEHAIELSKSYGWAYGEVPTIVVSSKNIKPERKNIEIFSGGLVELVNEKLKPAYKNVWLVGGPNLAKQFIHLKLADEIRLTVIPIILGDGTYFFENFGQEQALHLLDTTAYKNGMVELRYELKK